MLKYAFRTGNVNYDLASVETAGTFGNRRFIRNLKLKNDPQTADCKTALLVFELGLLCVSLLVFEREFFTFGSTEVA